MRTELRGEYDALPWAAASRLYRRRVRVCSSMEKAADGDRKNSRFDTGKYIYAVLPQGVITRLMSLARPGEKEPPAVCSPRAANPYKGAGPDPPLSCTSCDKTTSFFIQSDAVFQPRYTRVKVPTATTLLLMQEGGPSQIMPRTADPRLIPRRLSHFFRSQPKYLCGTINEKTRSL